MMPYETCLFYLENVNDELLSSIHPFPLPNALFTKKKTNGTVHSLKTFEFKIGFWNKG